MQTSNNKTKEDIRETKACTQVDRYTNSQMNLLLLFPMYYIFHAK